MKRLLALSLLACVSAFGQSTLILYLTSGNGAPSGTCPNNRIYIQLDATSNAWLWTCTNGVWNQQAGPSTTGGANTSLSNLGTVSINNPLKPALSTTSLGISGTPWGDLFLTQAVNGDDIINAFRNTDTSPTGNLEHFLNAAKNADLWTVDITGTLLAGIVPVARVTGLATVATSGSASNLSSGTLPAARLPLPSASTLGGVESYAAVTNQWLDSISTSGVPHSSQPGFSNLSGSLAGPQLPSFTGDVSNVAAALTVAAINGTTVPINSAADQLLGTSASATGAWLTLPSCADGTGHLNYTHAGGLTCGTAGGVGLATFLVASAANIPTNGVNLGALTNGILKQVVTGGVSAVSIAGYNDVVSVFNTGGACSGFLKSDGTCSAIGAGLADPGGNGLVKRTSLNVTTVAGFADVAAAFNTGGSCSGFLKSDGTCSIPGGGITGSGSSPQFALWTSSSAVAGSNLQQSVSTGQIVGQKSISDPYTGLSSSATPTIDMSLGSKFSMTLTANVTSITITNSIVGQDLTLEWCQNGTGNFTVTYPGTFNKAVAPDLAANACSHQSFYWNGVAFNPKDDRALSQILTGDGTYINVVSNVITGSPNLPLFPSPNIGCVPDVTSTGPIDFACSNESTNSNGQIVEGAGVVWAPVAIPNNSGAPALNFALASYLQTTLTQNSVATASNLVAGSIYAIEVDPAGFSFTYPTGFSNACFVDPGTTWTLGLYLWDGTNAKPISCYSSEAPLELSGPEKVAPSNPASGFGKFYFNSTSHLATYLDNGGNVSSTVKPFTATANFFATGWNPVTGAWSQGQPTLAGISGFPTPTRAGDIFLYNGTSWTTCPGNNGSTGFLQETGSGVCSWSSSGATVAWSSVQNPSAPFNPSMAGNTTEFDFSSALNHAFQFYNTTAATSSTSQNGPILDLSCGNEWHSAASTKGCVHFQFQPGNGTDALAIGAFAHFGSASGGVQYNFDGPVLSGTLPSALSGVAAGSGGSWFGPPGTGPTGFPATGAAGCYFSSATPPRLLCNWDGSSTFHAIPQVFFGTSAPGSVADNVPGDEFIDTTNHNTYVCNAPSNTAAPACTSVATAGWLQTNGSGGTFNPTITSPAQGQSVTYNGSGWVNAYPGVNVDPQTGNYTLACPTDRNGEIEFNISSAATLTVPQAGSTTCLQSNTVFVARNTSSSTAILTVSTTTSHFQPENVSSFTLLPGSAAFIYSDAVSSTGDWHAISVPVGFGGTNVKTANYTLTQLDKDKMVVMNCTSTCQATLPSTPPTTKWNTEIISIGSTLATLSLNGLNFNGSGTAPLLITSSSLTVRTDGANYFGNVPSSGGTSVSVNGSTVASPNFNGTTPSADSNNVASTFKVSGSNIISQFPIGALPPGTAVGSTDTGSPAMTFSANLVSFNQPVQTGTPPSCTVGTAATWCGLEGTAPTTASAKGEMWADSTKHEFMAQENGGAAGMVVKSRPSSIHSTGNTAAISTATLCSASAGNCDQAGQYHVHWDFIETGTACSAVTAGSVTFLLTWTDTNGTTHSAVSLGMFDEEAAAFGTSFHFNTTLGTAAASGDFNVSTNGAVIQYATGYTACTTGTGTYQLDAAVTRLQ